MEKNNKQDVLICYYIITDNPTIKVPLESQDYINLCGMNLIELVLPMCKEVYCSNNYLTELIVPEGCEEVYCYTNHLTKLIIPKTCKWICCYNNNLPKLIENLLQSGDLIKIQLANNLQKQKE